MGAPIYIKDANVKITIAAASKSVECDCRVAAVEPDDPDVRRYTTLCPTGARVAIGPVTWGLHLVGGQNWDAADGLAALAMANVGATATVRIQAHGFGVTPSATKPAIECIAIVCPPSYGGEEGTWAELDMTWPVVGQPTLIVAGPFMAEALDAEAEAQGDGTLAVPAPEQAAPPPPPA